MNEQQHQQQVAKGIPFISPQSFNATSSDEQRSRIQFILSLPSPEIAARLEDILSIIVGFSQPVSRSFIRMISRKQVSKSMLTSSDERANLLFNAVTFAAVDNAASHYVARDASRRLLSQLRV